MADMRMTKSEREAFLAAPRIAVVAIPADGGAPLQTPVHYSYEPGGEILFVSEASSEKASRLEVGTPLSMNVQDTKTHWQAAYVTVEGIVTAIDSENGREELFRIVDAYYGEEGGKLYRSALPKEMHMVAFRVRPRRWLSRDYKKRSGSSSGGA